MKLIEITQRLVVVEKHSFQVKQKPESYQEKSTS